MSLQFSQARQQLYHLSCLDNPQLVRMLNNLKPIYELGRWREARQDLYDYLATPGSDEERVMLEKAIAPD